MIYKGRYNSPLGTILLSEDDAGLRGLWFEGQKNIGEDPDEGEEKDTPILLETKRWLDIYFNGGEPDFIPQLHLEGTPFQKTVWSMLLSIPYGETVTYGEIAGAWGDKKMSSQAVGGAVGRNRVAIIVPCHRVIGKGGELTGYAGGLWRKKRLLAMEGIYDNK